MYWIRDWLALGLMAMSLVVSGCASEGNLPNSERTSAFRDWSVFTSESAPGRKCWIATTPTSMPSRYSSGKIFIMVRAEDTQLSIVSEGARFKAATGSLVIDTKRYEMIFEGKNGWSRNDADNYWIVGGLSTALRALIEVGDETLVFSAEGFREALSEARAPVAASTVV